MPDRIYLHTLGTFSVMVGMPPRSARVRAQNTRWLLAYLAARGPGSILREQIIRDLWPESPKSRARRRLSHTIWLARNELDPSIIVSDGDALRLGEVVVSDVQEFLHAAASATIPSLRKAVSLYAGDFLPECYQEWAQQERERLREMYLTILARLARLLEQEGQYEMAVEYARDWVRVDPLDESAHAMLMHLYLAMGHPAQAIQQYQRMNALLRRELGVTPSPALQSLYERIRAQHAAVSLAPPFVHPETIPLVGRESELALLRPLLFQAQQGLGSAVFLEGEAGIGKTRLLQEVSEEAQRLGLNVVWTHARSGSPYSPLPDAILALSERLGTSSFPLSLEMQRVLAHLVPDIGDPLPNVRPSQLHEAVTQFFSAAAQNHPLLLILDDMHNVSPETLHILTRLGRRVRTLPLILVVVYRPLEIQGRPAGWRALQELDVAAAPKRVRLGPLSSGGVYILVARALGVPVDHPVIQQLVPLSTGVPLYTLEMLRALYRRGILRREGGTWFLTEENVYLPGEIYALVQERIRTLPSRERQTLEKLAVVGEFIPTSICVALGGTNVTATLHTLERHGFLVADKAGYRFSHVVVHRATYDQIPEETRSRLHREVAQMLQVETPVPWSDVAFHLERGGREHVAVGAYLQAAQHAQRLFAHDQVITLCTRACHLVSTSLPDTTVCDLLLTRATSWFHLGRYARVRKDVAQAIRLARVLRSHARLARGCLLAGQVNFREGRYASALLFYTRAQRAALIAHLPDVAARVLSLISDVHLRRGDLEAARASAEDSYALYERANSDAGKALATYKLAVIAMEQGEEETARSAYRRVVEIAQQAEDLYLQGAALNALGVLALDRRETYQAQEVYTQALHIAERLGDSSNRVMTLHNLAVTALTAGRIGEAIRQSQVALDAAREVGSSTVQVLSMLLLGNLYTLCGCFEEAASTLHQVQEMAKDISYASGVASALRNLGILAREEGNLERAIDLGRQALEHLTQLALYRQVTTAAIELARSYLLQGEGDRAEEVLHLVRVEDLSPMWQAIVRALLAHAFSLQGKEGEARSHVRLASHYLETRATDEYLAISWYALANAVRGWDAAESRVMMARAYQAIRAQSLDLPAQWRESFLNRPLSHRHIVEAWMTRAPRPVVRLRITLPLRTGRGHREIIWTVDAGDEDALVEAERGTIGLRHHRLRRLLREAEAQGVRASHKILAEVLEVSVGTIRRDLAALKESEASS